MKFKVYRWFTTMRIGCPDSYFCSTKNEAEALCAVLEVDGYIARFEEIDSRGRAVTK
jgi:hypothetical protein